MMVSSTVGAPRQRAVAPESDFTAKFSEAELLKNRAIRSLVIRFGISAHAAAVYAYTAGLGPREVRAHG